MVKASWCWSHRKYAPNYTEQRFRLLVKDKMQLKSLMADCRSLQPRETNDPSETTWINRRAAGMFFIAHIDRPQPYRGNLASKNGTHGYR
jgi:hypothetical protein